MVATYVTCTILVLAIIILLISFMFISRRKGVEIEIKEKLEEFRKEFHDFVQEIREEAQKEADKLITPKDQKEENVSKK